MALSVASGEPRNVRQVEKGVPLPPDIKKQCFQEGEEQKIELTEQDASERLGIRQVGDEVIALIHNAWDEAVGGDTKIEEASDHEQLPGAKPIEDSGWHRATLTVLSLPYIS